MYNVLIFENQKYDIENRFKFINLTKFNNKLNFTYYQNSQELKEYNELYNYHLIIVDLDLSLKSEKDGYAIIRDIKNFSEKVFSKVFILTGSNEANQKLKEYDLENVPVLKKPIDIPTIVNKMKEILYQTK